MSYCKKCGQHVGEQQRFCSRCGAELSAQADSRDASSIFRPAADLDDLPCQAPDSSTPFSPAHEDNEQSGVQQQPQGGAFFGAGDIPAGGDQANPQQPHRPEPENRDQTHARKRSAKKRIWIAASCAAAAAVIVAAAVFALPALLKDSAQMEGTQQTFSNGDTVFTPDEEHIAFDDSSYEFYYNNELVVYTFSDLSQNDANALAETVDGQIVGDISGAINVLQISVQESTLSELNRMAETLMESEEVMYAGYDFPMQIDPMDAGSDPWSSDPQNPEEDRGNEESPNGNDWAQEAIGAYTAWEYSDQCQPITVGIYDCGFNTEHTELSGKFADLLTSVDGTDNDHGTKVAGLIAAKNNSEGIRGIANHATLICAAVDHSEKPIETSSVEYLLYIKQMIEKGAAAINISVGRYILGEKAFYQIVSDKIDAIVFDKIIINHWVTYEDYMKHIEANRKMTGLACMNMIAQLLLNGHDHFIIVQAAGNGYIEGYYSNESDAPYEQWHPYGNKGHDAKLHGQFQAIDLDLFNSMYKEELINKLKEKGIDYAKLKEHILVVGAVENHRENENYYMTSCSDYGANVDICAPGEGGYSTAADGDYGEFSGTSMAAPLVTGSVAYIWSLQPDLSAEEVRDILLKSTTHIAYGVGDDAGSTYPMLNLGQAVKTLYEPTEQEIIDAYKETCNFYSKWVSNDVWWGPDEDLVETYELGNVGIHSGEYFGKHCRTYDDEITTIKQFQDALNDHFNSACAKDYFERRDPIEDNGKLYLYYSGPWGSDWGGVDTISKIQKIDEHTYEITVIGDGCGGRLTGKIGLDYVDGKYHFYPATDYLYNENGEQTYPGDFAFYLFGSGLKLPEDLDEAETNPNPSSPDAEGNEDQSGTLLQELTDKMISAEVVKGTTEVVGGVNVTVDTLSVTIPGNAAAAQRIMDAFLSQKEEIYENWREIGPEIPGAWEELELEVKRADAGLISVYGVDHTCYGGEHSYPTWIGYTFSTTEGKELTLNDLSEDAAGLQDLLSTVCGTRLEEGEFEWCMDAEGMRIYLAGTTYNELYEYSVPYSDLAPYVYEWVLPAT